MYTIRHHRDSNILQINETSNNVFAKIYLNEGASLQELRLNGQALIQDLSPLTYNKTYASSILFPFANRVKDGVYTYHGKTFQLEVNQKEENNAIHGLVYNKPFQILETKTSNASAKIVLEYIENIESNGFPYTFTIQLEYLLTNTAFSLKTTVKNTDTKPFPFTLGWHPYFVSDDLAKSTLNFISNKKLIIGNRNITTGIKDMVPIDTFTITDKKLDDCWILNANHIQFNTPKYAFIMESSEQNNFLQLYTPPKLNTIAIEPTTGVSDSFNNKIGLQTLKPNKTYSVTWNLKINN